MFSSRLRIGPLGWRIAPPSEILWAAGVGLTVAGAAFAIWARLLLGGNWSSAVTIKRDHSLIRRGPYTLVRHPIYAGLSLAMLGTAIGCGETGAFLAVAPGFASWHAKSRIEESFLITRFGDS